MERTKLLTFAVIGLLILNLLTIGFLVVQQGRQSLQAEHRPGPLEGPAQLIIERLRFDESQQRQYLDMAHRHQQQTRRLNEKSVQLFQAYYKLLATAQPDSSKAHTLVSQIANVQRQMAELNFSHFQDIKLLCRSDQQADFAKLVNDLASLFGKPQQRRRPGDNGPPEGSHDGPPENLPPHP